MSYKKIIEDDGFGISETEAAIKIVHQIRNSKPIGLKGEYHPFAKHKLSKHPFNK